MEWPTAKWAVGVGKRFRLMETFPWLRRNSGVMGGDPIELARGWGSCRGKGLKSSPGPWKGGKNGRLTTYSASYWWLSA